MSWPLFWVLVLAPPSVFVVVVIAASAICRSRQRDILAGAAILSIALGMGACTTLFTVGGKDARIIVRNESSAPVYLSAMYEPEHVISPGSSDEIFSCGCGGFEFLDGLIQDARIAYGPSRSKNLQLRRVAGQSLIITITQGDSAYRIETP